MVRDDVSSVPSAQRTSDELDPELIALPPPRRPGRRLALTCLGLTALVSTLLAVGLSSEVRFALRAGPPLNLGELSGVSPSQDLQNSWVLGQAELGTRGAVEYTRPLDQDGYRLAPVAGNPRLWVQVRVPKELDGPRFVPPTTFVGRMLPLHAAGLRYSALAETLHEVGNVSPDRHAFVLIDGEAPATTRWAVGLLALFTGFAAFGIYGLARLLRPLSNA
jgi:hypothetical protein